MRKQKQFDVKRESLDAGSFEDRAARLELESFKPALRVPDIEAGYEANEQVEEATGLLPSPRLMNTNQFSIERARPEGKIHISARDRLDHFRRFLQRCR